MNRLLAMGVVTVVLGVGGCGDSQDGIPKRPLTYPPGKVKPLVRIPDEGGVVADTTRIEPAKGQLVYVSAYSHVYYGDGQRFLMAVTLSIRNTSPRDSILVRAVRYYDSAGHVVKEATDVPLRLSPMATVEYLIPERDPSGGSGANFVVDWVAESPQVTEPVIETIMVTTHSQGISFTATGRVIEELGPGQVPDR